MPLSGVVLADIDRRLRLPDFNAMNRDQLISYARGLNAMLKRERRQSAQTIHDLRHPPGLAERLEAHARPIADQLASIERRHSNLRRDLALAQQEIAILTEAVHQPGGTPVKKLAHWPEVPSASA